MTIIQFIVFILLQIFFNAITAIIWSSRLFLRKHLRLSNIDSDWKIFFNVVNDIILYCLPIISLHCYINFFGEEYRKLVVVSSIIILIICYVIGFELYDRYKKRIRCNSFLSEKEQRKFQDGIEYADALELLGISELDRSYTFDELCEISKYITFYIDSRKVGFIEYPSHVFYYELYPNSNNVQTFFYLIKKERRKDIEKHIPLVQDGIILGDPTRWKTFSK